MLKRSISIRLLHCFCSIVLFFCLSGPISAQSLNVELLSSDGEPVSDAVVEILLPENLRGEFSETRRGAIDQVDKEFVPTVTAVTVGSQLSFPNSDDILHHVYSFSEAKTFNIPLYGADENDDYFERFEQSGVVEIGCNIHDWMLAYIYVGESSLFAITDSAGVARIDNIPVGEFQLRIWHPRLAADNNTMLEQSRFEQGSVTSLDFRVELERDRRIRRAPSATRSRYN